MKHYISVGQLVEELKKLPQSDPVRFWINKYYLDGEELSEEGARELIELGQPVEIVGDGCLFVDVYSWQPDEVLEEIEAPDGAQLHDIRLAWEE